MKTLRMVLAAAAVLAAPLAADADVIGRRKADRAAVEQRLVEAGADPREASQLSEADARYFAAAPERVQAAGRHGDLVWIGCCSGLCALIILVLILL